MKRFRYLKGIYERKWPEGYVFVAQSERFLRSVFPAPKTVYLQSETGRGVALGHWFTLEYFTGSGEPKKRKKKGITLQVWNRIEGEQPKGWWSLGRFLSRGAIGIIDVRSLPAEYWRTWSTYGQRYRKKWLFQEQYEICSIDLETFLSAYQKSTLRPNLVTMFSQSLKQYAPQYGNNMELLGVRERTTGSIIAGLATLYDEETRQTFHPVAFIHPVAKKSYAQVGLMDAWFQRACERKMYFIKLGVMWLPWEPPSWKGYTEFKTHFSPEVYVFQPSLVRLYWHW